MKKIFGALVASAAFVAASPAAQAAIVFVPASSGQGTLVHGTGTEVTAYDVVANLGSNGPNIVHFTGDTTQTAATSDLLHLQKGSGQADIEGAEITLTKAPNDFYEMLSGNIFLTNHAGMDYLEFALTSNNMAGTVDFLLSDGLGGTTAFNDIAIGKGDTHYAFDTTGLSSITNLYWKIDAPAKITLLKQVRIDLAGPAGGVPEPSTWGMMILGLGVAGAAMRRRQRQSVRYSFA